MKGENIMKHRLHIRVEPLNLIKLIKSIGYTKSAESLGITPAAIKRYIKSGKAPKPTELAATSIIGMQAMSLSNDVTVIVRADQSVISAVKMMIESNKGTCTKLSL